MPPGLKRSASSKSPNPRTAWFPILTKVGEEYKLDVGWKYYDGSLGFFSTASKNCDVKPPWGEIVLCEFNRTVNNKGEAGDYFRFQNFKGQRCNFKVDLLNPKYMGVNDFTQMILELRAGGKVDLLAKFLSILPNAEGFHHHNREIHSAIGLLKDDDGTQLGDASEEEDLKKFIEYARDAAIVVETKKEVLALLAAGRKKEGKQEAVGKSASKKSKSEKIIDDKNAELEDKDGVEKSFIQNYVGRAEISIDNIELSEKLCIPINQFKVLGIAQSMKAQFDPSLVTLTVYPADEKNFDTENLDRNKYKIIHGNHRYLALLHLDKNGLLSSLPSLHDRCVVCCVVVVKHKSDVAYGNMRGNELAVKHQRKPYVHELVFVMDNFNKTYKSKDKALEMVLRCAKVLSVHPDEITALKKLSSWKPDNFQALILVLKKYEVYQTEDCKDSLERNNKRLMEGLKLKVTLAMFKAISRCDQDYFKENSQSVLDKKLSLKSLLGNVDKDLGKKKAYQIVASLTNFQSPEQLEHEYPGKFTEDKIDRYEGADIHNGAANIKGQLLMDYCKSVLNHEEINDPVKFEAVERLSEISEETLERFDIILLNLSLFDAGAPMTVIEVALRTSKPAMGVLALFRDEQQLSEAIKYLSILTRPKDFVVKHIYFEADNPKLVKGFLMNATYGLLFGKVILFEPPLKMSNGDLKNNLKQFIRKISPTNAKIAFLNQGNLPITSIHTALGDSAEEVVYFGNKQALDKFLSVKEKVVTEKVVTRAVKVMEPKVSVASVEEEKEKTRSLSGPSSSFNYVAKMAEIAEQLSDTSSDETVGQSDEESRDKIDLEEFNDDDYDDIGDEAKESDGDKIKESNDEGDKIEETKGEGVMTEVTNDDGDKIEVTNNEGGMTEDCVDQNKSD